VGSIVERGRVIEFVFSRGRVRIFWSVAIGAAIGGVSRYYLAGLIQQRSGADFPVGTLVINVTGSFVLGFVIRYALQSDAFSPEMRALLTTGFCGGYTTFSAFSYETMAMLNDGKYGRATAYVGTSVALAVVATFFGFAAASRVFPVRAGV
jgi:CrcB protein